MGSLGTPSSPYRRPLSFVGLYDGHNGTAAAAFLHQHLPTALLRAPVSASIPEAMVAAAAELDAALCAHLAHERDPSGATALFAVVDGAAGPSQTLHVANVGDSKCVLSRNGGRAEALTREHRPARPDERSRIEAAGAVVHHDRVNGVLAVTRSFGDEGHKAGGDAKEGALICTPEITTRTVQPDWEFVLLASDGAWDVLGTQQAVDCVRSHLAHTPSLNSAAAAVVKETLARGSTDNVSVALLAFHQQQHGQGHGHGGWEEAAAWA